MQYYVFSWTRERTWWVLQLLQLQTSLQQRSAFLPLLAAPPALGRRVHTGIQGDAAPQWLSASHPHPQLHPEPVPSTRPIAVHQLLLRQATTPCPLPGPAACIGGGQHAVPLVQEPTTPVLQSHDEFQQGLQLSDPPQVRLEMKVRSGSLLVEMMKDEEIIMLSGDMRDQINSM